MGDSPIFYPSPPTSIDEALTEQFYAWEKRGRGWQLFDYPVTLEPPFRPFLGHYVSFDGPREDARRPSLFGGIFEALRGETQRPALPEPSETWEIVEPEPEVFLYDGPLGEIEVGLPPDLKVTRDRATHLLARVASGRNPVSFEIIGISDSISVQFACAGRDETQALGQIPAFFPEAVLRPRQTFLESSWHAAGPATMLVDFGLSREFMAPLRCARDFDVDPFVPLVAALGELSAQEVGIFQVVFESVRNPWAESIMRAVTDGDGRSFFAETPGARIPRERKGRAAAVCCCCSDWRSRTNGSEGLGYCTQHRRGAPPILEPHDE